MMQSPDPAQVSMGLRLMGRNCGRIGHHLTNVAENIYFIAAGESFLKTNLQHLAQPNY